MTPSPAHDDLLARAVALSRQGRAAEAAAAFRTLLERQPDHADALHRLGLLEIQQGRPAVALGLLERAAKADPAQAMVHFNRGRLLQSLGRPADALNSLDAAVAVEPRYAKAQIARAEVLAALGHTEAAIQAYARAAELAPDDPAAQMGQGELLYRLRRYQEALSCFEHAVRTSPGQAAPWINCGCSFLKIARPAQALDAFDRSLALGAESADVHFNRGLALADLGRHALAVDSYTRALALAPYLPEALGSRAASWNQLRRPDQALADLDARVALVPASAEAHADRAGTLFELGRLPEAARAYEQALALDSGLDFALEALLQTRQALCDWRDFDRRVKELERRVREGLLVSPALSLAILHSAPLQRQCAERYAAFKYPPESDGAPAPRARRDGRIRIGYFSGDFFSHATAYLMAGLFEQHDRDRFEVFAFSFGRPGGEDAMNARLQAALEHFIDVSGQTDEQVVAQARQLGIDIAVDLKGLTQGARPRIFAMRAAPLQVAYLGYPCTTGMASIDYLVGDPVVVGADAHFTEKILCLPHSYQVNDDKRVIASKIPSRRESGLPERGFVFCCFNNLYKITPEVFDVWISLLRQVEGSVLWLLQGSPDATRNLRGRMQSRGLDPARLVFAARTAPPEHLARHGAADLFLDTNPCNAHTTASDALWAGLPVLTCMGETFAGRVAASLLHAAGLPELVAPSLSAYEAAAVELAVDGPKLSALRQRLARNRLSCPLFDTARFTKDLEAGYMMIHERRLAGQPPARLEVPAAATPSNR